MKRPDKEGKQMILNVYSVLDYPDNHFETLRPGIVIPKGLLKDKILLLTGSEIITLSPK